MIQASRRTRLLSNRRSIQTRRWLRRLLLVENLETRTLMASDTFADPNDLRIGVSAVAPPWNWQLNAPGMGGSGNGSGSGLGTIPLSDTFKLHSRPTATKTIYLDFDGFTARFTPWRPDGDLVSPPYDFDGNPGSFSDRELQEIQATWQRVTADFAAFDVNVTTEDPGEDALVNTGGTDDRWGIRVVITPDSAPAPGTGGVAYLGSFRWGYNRPGATDTPCYTFNISPDSTAQTISHEVGHSLGLVHDGSPAGEYYFGHGSGETGWGPIMGAGFGRNITTWSRGEYFAANNNEDDLSIITSAANGFGFIPDEVGDARGTAAELTGPINALDRNVISQFGRIERASDLDFFRLQVGGGLFDLTIDPYITQTLIKKPDDSFATSIEGSQFIEGTNLDIEANLMDEAGNIIATSNPANSLKAQFNLDLSPGVYYLSVDGVGFGNPLENPPVGYTDYGSLGQYLISGSFPVAFGIAVPGSVVTYTENDAPKAISTGAKVIDNFPGTYASGSLIVGMTPASGATDFITLDFSGSPDLFQTGSMISFRGIPTGNLVNNSDTSFRVDFRATATKEAIEAIVNSIRFEARGEAPDTFSRSILITLTKGSAKGTTSIQLNVISVNDRPLALVSTMNEIDEDATNTSGTKVDVLIDRGIIDVDGTKAKAIVLTGSPNSPVTPGKWQYEVGRGWKDLGPVSTSAGLVLGPTASLRFLPNKDFYGTVPPLNYYALDPTYLGEISSAALAVFVNTQTVVAPDSISSKSGVITQSVRPVNDPPVAKTPFPSTSVLQGQPLRYTLPIDLFSDVDNLDTELVLRASTRPGVGLPSWLNFDPASRTFTGTPANQDVGTQQLMVRATDPSEAFGDATVTIDVINVNDAPTDIRLVGQPVPENRAGAFIGQLTAVDPDRGDSVVWSIVQNPSDIFEVRGDKVFLSPFSSFNFEAQNTWTLTVRATDNGTPPLFLEKELTVTVEDVNEFSPNFGMMSFSVSEAATGGDPVGRVVATDGDLANSIRYRFFGQAPSQFTIADDGLISVKPDANLDFETVPTYQFLVQAFDNGTPSLSTWASVTVSIMNANEFSPIITTETLAISESFTTSPVARVIATDGDKQAVGFSLKSSETRFSIDENTGELRLLGDVLDYELRREEKLVVTVFDKGLSPSLSSEKTITISVLDGNDPPSAVTLNTNKVPTNVSGVPIGRIDIKDPDGQTNYEVASLDNRFQVVAGNLQLRSDLFLRDTDPQIFTVPLLLNDVAAKVVYRMNVTVERVSNPTPWKNDTNPMDVNRDGGVDALDVLSVINMINSGASRLPVPRDGNSLATGYVDVDGDGQVTPLDVLAIVNIINAPSRRLSGEGEGSSALSPRVAIDDYFAQYGTESDPIISRSRRLARSRNS